MAELGAPSPAASGRTARASRPGYLQIPGGKGQQHSPPLVVALCASYSGSCYVVPGHVSRKGILSEAKLLLIAI